jgi:ATP-dependent Clp protease ATP-binding subunit ClpC
MTTEDISKTLSAWIDIDLSAAAATGALSRAFGVDDALGRIDELLSARRNPVVVGESGVGKTAIIHEIARRVDSGTGPAALAGKRLVQISFRRQASLLQNPHEKIRPEMGKLVDALCHSKNVVPFFHDLDVAMQYGLVSQIQNLCLRSSEPILAEGPAGAMQSAFEIEPDLAGQLVTVAIAEPSVEQMQELLREWNDERIRSDLRPFKPAALEEALYLAHRFLVRDRHPRKTLDLLGHIGARRGAVLPTEILDRFCRAHRDFARAFWVSPRRSRRSLT